MLPLPQMDNFEIRHNRIQVDAYKYVDVCARDKIATFVTESPMHRMYSVLYCRILS